MMLWIFINAFCLTLSKFLTSHDIGEIQGLSRAEYLPRHSWIWVSELRRCPSFWTRTWNLETSNTLSSSLTLFTLYSGTHINQGQIAVVHFFPQMYGLFLFAISKCSLEKWRLENVWEYGNSLTKFKGMNVRN